MRTEKDQELKDSLLQREPKKPYPLMHILDDEIGGKLNTTIAQWNKEFAHHDLNRAMQGTWLSWQTILSIFANSTVMAVLVSLVKKKWRLWAKPKTSSSSEKKADYHAVSSRTIQEPARRTEFPMAIYKDGMEDTRLEIGDLGRSSAPLEPGLVTGMRMME